MSNAQAIIEKQQKENQPLLSIEGLSKSFAIRGSGGIFARKKQGKAIDNVSLEVKEGETFGIVGESGSGKSTLLLCIAQIMIPEEGTVTFKGDRLIANGKPVKVAKGRIQMVFQDPNSSLNPTLAVRQIVAEPLGPLKVPKDTIHKRVEDFVDQISLNFCSRRQ